MRKSLLNYPLIFHFDTQPRTKWALGVWRALSVVQ